MVLAGRSSLVPIPERSAGATSAGSDMPALKAYDGTYAACSNCFYRIIKPTCRRFRYAGNYHCKSWKDGTVPQKTLSSFMGDADVNSRHAPAKNKEVNEDMENVRAVVLSGIAAEYEEVWKRMAFIKDDYARVRACNMVLMNDELPPMELPPEVSKAIAERKAEAQAVHLQRCFDHATNNWFHCPECGTKNIKQKARSGKEYTACRTCKIFLNDQGEVAPMDAEKSGKQPYRVTREFKVEPLSEGA